jgi:hypothetical protein
MRYLLVSLVVALSGISAFAEDDYCPLHVGDEWTYEIAHIDPKGAILTSPDHSRIRGTIEYLGKSYFVFEQWGGEDPPKKENTSYVRKDEKGVHTTFPRSASGAEILWLSFPLKIGASWKYDDGMTCTVVGLEKVVIGATTYQNCYHVVAKSVDRTFTSDAWVAPNVGAVKSVDVFSDGAKRTKTLVEFKPGR